jgi:hypothetical protein
MTGKTEIQLNERQRNAASVGQVPERELPTRAAQLVLIALCLTGHDVSCYQCGGPWGVWCVWLGDLADARADHNGRVTLAEWQARFLELLVEMGYTTPEGGEDA